MSGFFNGQKLPIKIILIGAGIAVAVMLLLTCAVSAVISFISAVPYSAMPYIILIADAGGAFCGAYFIASVVRSRGLILGLICGLILFIVVLIAGLSTGETITVLTVLKLIVFLIFGMLGGIAGVNKKERIHIK